MIALWTQSDTEDLEISLCRILIGGDTCPIGINAPLFGSGDGKALVNDLRSEFERADLVIVNLECPLIESESPIEKCGPHLGAATSTARGLRSIGIDVVGLANNHIMDHGKDGLSSTIAALKAHCIDFVGAGRNLAEARRIKVMDVRGLRVGILAMAEYEFGIACVDRAGANPIDVIEFVRTMNCSRGEFDLLVVLLHGGNEFYQFPRPSLMEMCRFLVEQGAGAVVCQHSHCVGCKEIYQGAPIIYGQGNFLFDFPSDHASWHKGALVLLDVDDRDLRVNLSMVPFRQSPYQPGIQREPDEASRATLEAFERRSKALLVPGFVEKQWEQFCFEQRRHFLHILHGKRTIGRRIAGRLGLLKYLDSKEKQRNRLHYLRCESYREAIIKVLSSELRDPSD
ncbi:MAG: CapA family protein [Pseudomonadota bacterium]